MEALISYNFSFPFFAQMHLIWFYNVPQICRNDTLDYNNVPKEVNWAAVLHLTVVLSIV